MIQLICIRWTKLENATFSSERRLQFVTIEDSPKLKINNGYKMLKYYAGDIILVWGALYDKMLIGYVIDNQSSTVSHGEKIEWGLIETKNLDFKSIQYFPQGHRRYQIFSWSIFGMEIKYK